jgi:ATP-dependent helicase/nuclease subunit A
MVGEGGYGVSTLTVEQMRASDPQSSVWVSASAGTGKTYVLTSRVLRLMLTGTPPGRILCLTYTNAAASEMANRVNNRLSYWVLCDEEQLNSELKYLIGDHPTNEQKELARKLFAQVLDVPGGIKIQTIHAFCQSLLGRFPIEANVAPHFELMDDRTILEYLRTSQDELFNVIRNDKDKKLNHSLAHITALVTENTFGELMNELKSERGGLDELRSKFVTIERMIISIKDILEISSNDTSEIILNEACLGQNFDGEALLNVASALSHGSKTDAIRGEIIYKWVKDDTGRVLNFNVYKEAFLTKGDIRKNLITKAIQKECPHGFDILAAEASRLQFVEDRLKRMSLVDNSEAILRVGFALIDIYTKSKVRHSVLDYDDLILKVRNLFRKNNIADWILFKLDGGLDHILIDEAQDTNPDQWHVVQVLASEFFAGFGTRDESAQEKQPRTIFAVGDVKQSIYSFQKADPKEFVDNQHFFKKKVTQANLNFDVVPMNLSFRSTSVILDVVDEVFKDDESRISLSFSTDEIKHKTSRTGDAGLIEIWETVRKEEIEENEEWSPPVIQKPSTDPSWKVAEKIADQIEQWIENKEILPSKNRPINAGDILILVRHRNDFIQYMIRALKKRKVKVSGLDRMKLTDQLAVMDLMAIAKFALLPSDDLTLAVVLKSPFIGLCEDDLFDIAHYRSNNETLWSSLLKKKNDRDAFLKAVHFLTKLTNYADFVPPFEFFSNLLGPMQGRKYLIRRLGDQANDPIDEFLALAMTYEKNNISSMQGFISWVERGDKEIKRDMEQGGDMVRIMTVHGAKGLQAPIVFLPDTCQIPLSRNNLYWIDDNHTKQMLWIKKKDAAVGAAKIAYDTFRKTMFDEYKRLLYVALTRAEDRLYITGWEGIRGRDDECWYDLIKNAVSNMKGVQEVSKYEENILRLESQQTADTKTEEINIIADDVSPILPEWVNKPPGSEPIPSKPLTPSKPSTEDEVMRSPLKLINKQKLDKQKYYRGRLIHKLLEILPDLDIEKQESAAQKFLKQDVHELNDHGRDIIIKEVMSIIHNIDMAALFGSNSRSEVPIVGQIGEFTVSGQVDRLAVLDNEILIVDYKTNRPPPKNTDDIPKIYVRQMAAYKKIIGDIYPKRHVRCILLWTDIGRLMEIPNKMLAKIKF